MFVRKTSLLTLRRWARPLALAALLMTSSAVFLTGCAGSKPDDGASAGGAAQAGTGKGGAALAPDAGAAKDQAILKQTTEEKNLDGK